MRCAVCRCFLGAWRSPCRIWSIKGITACSFGCGRSVFLRGLGKALAIASRTLRRCTFTFLATPAIVPTPNSYSRRISSKSSTLGLQSHGFPLSGYSPIQGIRSLPRWAKLDRRTGPIQSTEINCSPFARIALYCEGDLFQNRRQLVKGHMLVAARMSPLWRAQLGQLPRLDGGEAGGPEQTVTLRDRVVWGSW